MNKILVFISFIFLHYSLQAQVVHLPENPAYVINVKDAPFNAKGDGFTDDTQAIQQAIYASITGGTTQIVFIPKGTYVLTEPIHLAFADGSPAPSGPWLKGESQYNTIFRVESNSPDFMTNITDNYIGVFNVPCEGTDKFHQHKNIQNFTIELGDNSTACGIKMCGQTNLVKNVRIKGNNQNAGIILGNNNVPSNALILKTEIKNCDLGISCYNALSNYTLSEIMERNVGTGLKIQGSTVSIDNLSYLDGYKTGIEAVDVQSNFSIVNSAFTFTDAANSNLFTYHNFYARNIHLVNAPIMNSANLFGTLGSNPSKIEEIYTSPLFKSQVTDLNGMLQIPIETTPKIHYDPNLDNWVNVADFGANCADNIDDADAIQEAIDFAVATNKTTIYFPGCGFSDAEVYLIEDRYLTVGGNINHFIGLGNARFKGNGFILNDTYSNELVFEHMYGVSNGLSFENSDINRTIILEDIAGAALTTDNGTTFINNFSGQINITNSFSTNYGRGINTYLYDNEDSAYEGVVNIINQGGDLWLSGVRNEQPNTVMATVAGGASELLGGIVYFDTLIDEPFLFYTDDAETTVSNFQVKGLAANGGVSQFALDYAVGENVGTMLYNDTPVTNSIIAYSDADAIKCPPDGTGCNDGNPYSANDFYLDCKCGGQSIQMNIKALLEGYYDSATGELSSILNQKHLLPITQPFGGAPFFYGGTESNFDIPLYVADWILVELRSASNKDIILYRQAGFITVDGNIIDFSSSADGVVFPGLPTGSYYFALYHRSHLPIITKDLVTISGTEIDFIDLRDETILDGYQPITELEGTSQKGMYAGDFDQNALINNLDYNIWQADNSVVNAYVPQDADGNGIVNNLDYNWWVKNRSKVGPQVLHK